MRYAAKASACNACHLKGKCTNSPKGQWVSRSIKAEYLERVRAYRETEPYRKALRKRAVWVEPLLGEAKEWHGLRRFRLRRVLSEEIAGLDTHLDRLVARAAPELISLLGIGTENAATLLIVAGDNPQRLGSEASFANLCGVAPIEASSGKVLRHRLKAAVATGRPIVRCVHDLPGSDETRSAHQGVCRSRRTAGEAWQEQARDHPLPQALRRKGGLPGADLLRRPFLADRVERRSPHRLREQRRLTIGPSVPRDR